MTPQAERRTRMSLWTVTTVFTAGACGLSGLVFFCPRSPRPLPTSAPIRQSGTPAWTENDVSEFARKRMSKAVVKAPPPTPPKPVLPALDLLVRLSGILAYGPDKPCEAFIETRQNNQTKSYRVGDTLAGVGAVVKGISDGVLIEYDGKLWKLTDRGAQPATEDAVSTGTKP
jgi:hypothetical protein